MNRKTISIISGVTALVAVGCGKTKQNNNGSANEKMPNIIYILADDMGYGDVSALNSESKIPTPALDKMVHNGISFCDAHTNSSLSTPTRYGILTGRYTFRSRLKQSVLTGHEPSLIEPNRPTVATLLRDNGYRTACVGKWHLGLDWARKDTTKALYDGAAWDIKNTENVDYAAPVRGGASDNGFDYSYIIPASLDIAPYVYIENGKVNAPVRKHVPEWSNPKARGMWYRHGDVADNFDHNTCLQHLTAKAIDYINTSAKNNKPFFLYFPLTAPHTPWLPSAEFEGKSGAGVYGDFVCMVDDVVRQVQDALEKNGIAENTIIIFTSDNGSHWIKADIEATGHRANYVFSGMKSDIWEGGHHVPFIVSWPAQIKKAQTVDEIICTTDFMATCAEMLGVKLTNNEGEDSFSFWKILTGQKYTSPLRPSTVHHSSDGYFALRKGNYVWLNCSGSGGWSLFEDKAEKLPNGQLYNLKTDISEQKNISNENPELVQAMKKELQQIIDSGHSREMQN